MNHLTTWYQGKNVLVTGGAGFIGSHLVDSLVSFGAHVTVLDNLSTGSLENLQDSLSRISFIKGDITSTKDCEQATKNQQIVFHCAAFVSVPLSHEQPDLCNSVNIGGTLKLLQASRTHRVTSFVFSSSCSVYGDTRETCAESTPLNPQSPYASSKVDGEKLCHFYALTYGLSTVCLRYFNIYGPRQKPEGHYAAVVARFSKALREGRPLEIYGDGLQTRDFTPVRYAVHANLGAAMNLPSKGEIFNVATGKSTSLLNLISRLEQRLEKKAVRIEFKPARVGDIKHSYANSTKLKELLAHYL